MLACCGDVATMEALAAAAILRERTPDLKLRFVNVVDLFKLQPKKPNWDLKRDLNEKMRTGGLERETENAIARLVRERVEAQKNEKLKIAGNGEGEEVGMEGGELVEAMHQREAEEERERRRDEEDDAAVEG